MFTNTLKVVQITLGSNYVKHYLGVMRNHMHITKSPQMHQLNSLDLLFWPYLPIYGPVWLHWPYFTVLAHILLPYTLLMIDICQ